MGRMEENLCLFFLCFATSCATSIDTVLVCNECHVQTYCDLFLYVFEIFGYSEFHTVCDARVHVWLRVYGYFHVLTSVQHFLRASTVYFARAYLVRSVLGVELS